MTVAPGRVRAVLVGAWLGLAGSAPGRAAEGGATLYQRYCAPCHGVDGRGRGPAAEALTPRPTDLTRLVADVPALMRAIDGRRTIRAHGDAGMPVWGRVFEESRFEDRHARRATLLAVQSIAEHARHLQTVPR
ncbi:MAG: c-type cytochrome [Candidatus Binatia bacterium]